MMTEGEFGEVNGLCDGEEKGVDGSCDEVAVLARWVPCN